MKRFCVFACLCLICVVLMADTALAGDVSSTAISLDLAAGSVEIYESEGITYCVQNEVTQATTGGVIVRQTDNATATANTITVSRGTCNTPVGYTATFGASVDNNNGNIGIIRAFVLPSLGNPIPLANSAEIK